jgi:hypothetical protein
MLYCVLVVVVAAAAICHGVREEKVKVSAAGEESDERALSE